MRIVGIEFRPPLAFARLGGASSPMDSYVWREDPTVHGTARNVLDPAVSLEVLDDGSVLPFVPTAIRFRERGQLRPVAPFFELWAEIIDGDPQANPPVQPTLVPLTEALLTDAGGELSSSLVYDVAVANRKAARRSGSDADAFAATTQARGDDHARRQLLASSAGLPEGRPLVRSEDPIPLGWFQVIRPVSGLLNSVDLDVLRVRFTPAAGAVYGPPNATTGTDPATGRSYEIVPPANRFLNPEADWLRYRIGGDDSPGAEAFYHPQPSDTYDGADQGRQQSWGVVDDTCDGVITAHLVLAGHALSASARVCVGPPDYAPDRRPFVSLADDLADRDQEPMSSDEIGADLLGAQRRLADLFQRIWETATLTNLDAIRARAVRGNADSAHVEGTPATNEHSMRPSDRPWADANVDALIPPAGQPSDELIFTTLVGLAHAPLADEDNLIQFFSEHSERLRQMVRPAYGTFAQYTEAVHGNDDPADDHRDPRITRDNLHDMRMPPYMRDETASALSLNRRQYAELINYLTHAAGVLQRRGALAGAGAGTHRMSTPLRRRIDARLNTIGGAEQ